jgi:hypothetical protein
MAECCSHMSSIDLRTPDFTNVVAFFVVIPAGVEAVFFGLGVLVFLVLGFAILPDSRAAGAANWPWLGQAATLVVLGLPSFVGLPASLRGNFPHRTTTLTICSIGLALAPLVLLVFSGKGWTDWP